VVLHCFELQKRGKLHTLLLPHTGGQGCFSGETKVVVQGVKEPVQLQDLRVGQHVVCYDGGVDMLAPGAPRWCEVNNFVSTIVCEVVYCGVLYCTALTVHCCTLELASLHQAGCCRR
jgi:hypothetical protein